MKTPLRSQPRQFAAMSRPLRVHSVALFASTSQDFAGSVLSTSRIIKKIVNITFVVVIDRPIVTACSAQRDPCGHSSNSPAQPGTHALA